MDQPAKNETSQIYINLTRFFLNKPIYFFSCIETLIRNIRNQKSLTEKIYGRDIGQDSISDHVMRPALSEQRSAVPHTHHLPMHGTANASHRFHRR